MIRQSIDRIVARSHKLSHWYQRYEWRRSLGVSIGAATLNLTLAYFPLSLGPQQQLSLAPAILILVALFCGALATLLTVVTVAVAQLFLAWLFFEIPFNPWIYGLSAVTAMLLRTRWPIVLALLAYCTVNLLPLIWQIMTAAQPRAEQWSMEAFGSIANFSLAAAVWTLLPRRSYITRRNQRRSLAQKVFSWSMTASLLPLLIVAAVVNAGGGGNFNSHALLAAAVVAAIVCAWLSHTLSASINNLTASTSAGTKHSARVLQRKALSNVPAELARVALYWQRRLLHLQRRMLRADDQLTQERGSNERLRASMLKLTNRLQEQSQTLLQSQQRDTISVQKLEEALRQANVTIEKIRNSQILFIATMSHEVRTPLHGLMSTLSLLREETLSAEGVRRLGIARTSARSLLQIANDILDLSRIEAGGFSLESAAFNPRSLVREIVEEFQATAQSQRLDLVAVIADDLPNSLLGDRARIRQIISNLVTNALKFTPSGGVTIRVTWRGGKMVIDVIDTGKGIPADKRKIIFDAFVQIDSATNRRFAGTGLGLTIGLHLAQAMGGSLTLHSTSTEGSTFRLELTLPVSDEPVPEDQSQRILARYNGHILVVEDNDANQYVARVLLESLGCTVTVAGSGVRALQLVQETQFDLIFMDCQLPGMDGFETSQRLRATLTKRIPIVAMTANALAEAKGKALEAGMDDFLAKPFTKAMLSKVLSQWLADSDDEAADDGSPTGRGEPVIDPAVFDELWESLRWRTKPLQEIYNAVMDNVRNTIQLLSALETTPMQRILRSLHTVRGSSSMVGAKRITRIAAMLEQAASNDQLDRKMIEEAQLPKALRDLEVELDQRLAAYINNMRPG